MRLPGLAPSAIVGPTARQYPQNDDDLVGIIEAEAHTPIADPQAPLDRIELPDVAASRSENEPVESIQYPTLHRSVESLQITPCGRRDPIRPPRRQSRSSSARSWSEESPSPRW
jgi:hypothetical protein